MEESAELADYKEAYKKLEKKKAAIEKDMSGIKNEVIAKYCPHKLGDKMLVTKTQTEYYLCSIDFYFWGIAIKWNYHFSKEFTAGTYNPAVFFFGQYEWI